MGKGLSLVTDEVVVDGDLLESDGGFAVVKSLEVLRDFSEVVGVVAVVVLVVVVLVVVVLEGVWVFSLVTEGLFLGSGWLSVMEVDFV